MYNFCKAETKSKVFFDVFGKNLRDFLCITQHCTALIGNEGGAVNMAKALDIPTFTIFSPWIKKEAWSMFEDGHKHVSVHLSDFQPQLFEGKKTKELKADQKPLYEMFSPDYFIDQLKTFLKQ